MREKKTLCGHDGGLASDHLLFSRNNTGEIALMQRQIKALPAGDDGSIGAAANGHNSNAASVRQRAPPGALQLPSSCNAAGNTQNRPA